MVIPSSRKFCVENKESPKQGCFATQSSHCIRGKYAALQSLASLLCDIRPEFGRVMAAPQEGSCDRLRSAAAAHYTTAVVVFRPLAHPSAQRPHQSVRPCVRGLALAVMSAMSVCGERASEREGSNFPGERMREPKFLLALLPPSLLLLRPTGPMGAEGPKSQIESRGSVDRGLLRIWTCGAGKQKGAS